MEEVWFFDEDGAKRIPIGESHESFNIGDLSREAFDELKDWEMLQKDNCYIAFRQGIKKGIFEEMGDMMELHIYFTAFLRNRSYAVTEEEIESLYQQLVEEMDSRTNEYAQKNPGVRIVSLTYAPADYMKEELRAMLPKPSTKLTEEQHKCYLSVMWKALSSQKGVEISEDQITLMQDNIDIARSVGFHEVADRYDSLLRGLVRKV